MNKKATTACLLTPDLWILTSILVYVINNEFAFLCYAGRPAHLVVGY